MIFSGRDSRTLHERASCGVRGAWPSGRFTIAKFPALYVMFCGPRLRGPHFYNGVECKGSRSLVFNQVLVGSSPTDATNAAKEGISREV